jgi:hypothetical protein
MSYDNSAGLGADTWRHVVFIEQRKPAGLAGRRGEPRGVDVLALASQGPAGGHHADHARPGRPVPLADAVGHVQPYSVGRGAYLRAGQVLAAADVAADRRGQAGLSPMLGRRSTPSQSAFLC